MSQTKQSYNMIINQHYEITLNTYKACWFWTSHRKLICSHIELNNNRSLTNNNKCFNNIYDVSVLHRAFCYYLSFQYFDFECTGWRLFQKRVLCTNLDIYGFVVKSFPFENIALILNNVIYVSVVLFLFIQNVILVLFCLLVSNF
jgi:hypothetical protein